jgi:hypothetical protein
LDSGARVSVVSACRVRLSPLRRIGVALAAIRYARDFAPFDRRLVDRCFPDSSA